MEDTEIELLQTRGQGHSIDCLVGRNGGKLTCHRVEYQDENSDILLIIKISTFTQHASSKFKNHTFKDEAVFWRSIPLKVKK